MSSCTTSALKVAFRAHLLGSLDSIGGPIQLVLEPSFAPALSACVADASTLKDHGVQRFCTLDGEDEVASTKGSPSMTVVYVIHGTIASGARAARHAGRLLEATRKTVKNDRVEFCVVSFPRVLNITRAMFEKELVHEAVFLQVPCAWVPLARDVLSLEYDDDAVRELFVNGLNSSLPYDIAYALFSISGSAKTVQARGKLSCKVAEMIRRMRREAGRVLENVQTLSGIDELILIDRSCDLVTPMCTQLTYEGLLDEVFNMRYGQIKHDTVNASGLNEEDPVFRETRDKLFMGARAWVNTALREIQRFRDVQMSDADVSALRGFVSSLKDNFSRMTLHTTLLEKLAGRMSSPTFSARQQVEASILEDTLKPQSLRDIIYKEDELSSVLRLMCLLCAVGGGIPKLDFDILRKEVLNTYGFEHIETFERLQDAGLLYGKEDRTRRSAFSDSKVSMKLLVNDASKIDAENPEDMHFAYAGYAPWSCRMVEEALMEGWQTRLEDRVPTIHVRQGLGDDGSAHDTVVKHDPVREVKGKKTPCVMVMFIGGVTSAEIAALRFLGEKRADCQIIVASTGIVTGSRLVNALSNGTPMSARGEL